MVVPRDEEDLYKLDRPAIIEETWSIKVYLLIA
jgi:hypothetical protein